MPNIPDHIKASRDMVLRGPDPIRQTIDSSAFENDPNLKFDPDRWKIGVEQKTMREFIDTYPDNPPLPFPLHHVKPNTPVEADSDLVFYIHIPKTAGQTFHRIMGRTFRNCSLHDDHCNRRPELNQIIARRLDLTFATNLDFQHFYEQPQDFKRTYANVASGLGHVDASIGLTLLPRRSVFITVLRDPAERVSSWFNYMKSNADALMQCISAKVSGKLSFVQVPGARGYWDTDDKKLAQICNEPSSFKPLQRYESLEEFVDWQNYMFDKAKSHDQLHILGPNTLPNATSFSEFVSLMPKLKLDNYMVRAFTGTTSATFVPRAFQPQTDQEKLALAKDFLRRMPFFGITNRFEDTVKLYLWTFGFSFPENWKAEEFAYNLSKKKEVKEDTPEMKQVKEMEWMDKELYDFALGLFDERVKRMEADMKVNPPKKEGKKPWDRSEL